MSAPSRAARARRRQAGFNLLEVMIALVVMTIAVTGAASLQTATTQANIAARERATAVEFLQSWIERVKLDAMGWRAGGAAAVPNLFSEDNASGNWFLIDSDSVLLDATDAQVGHMAASFFGLDTTTLEANGIRYCVNLRGQVVDPGRALRADVRVWWHREGGDSPLEVSISVPNGEGAPVEVTGPLASDRSLVQGCATGPEAPVNDPRVYSVTASTILVAN